MGATDAKLDQVIHIDHCMELHQCVHTAPFQDRLDCVFVCANCFLPVINELKLSLGVPSVLPLYLSKES